MAEGGENSGGHNTYPVYNGVYSPAVDTEDVSGGGGGGAAAAAGASGVSSTISTNNTSTTTTSTTVEVQVQLIPNSDSNIHLNYLNNHINNIPSCSSTTTTATNSDINIPKINQHCNNKAHTSNNINSNKNNNNFKCIICNLNYQKKLEYVLHVRQNHVGSEKYRCDLCVKVCTSYPALLRHKIMSHTSGKCT